MKHTIAQALRDFAQWLEPQPITIELCQTEGPVGEVKDLRGFPAYFWRTDERSFSLYPIPDREVRLCARYGA